MTLDRLSIRCDRPSDRLAALALALGSLVLAVHPVSWLVHTWRDPSYGSQGLWVALGVAALFAWSVSSPASTPSRPTLRAGLVLLLVTALVRLAGQLLGINIVGALALVLDVLGLGLLCGLAHRRRALSPGWLAVLFAFSLPLERVLQRSIGFGLQQVSASISCKLLELAPDPVHCEGIRILLAGQDVLVDLPCSGARGLLALMMLFAALSAVRRPSVGWSVMGIALTLAVAAGGNALRIVVLALGIAYRDHLGGVDVMEAPWHEAIGIATLGLGALALLGWAGLVPRARDAAGEYVAPTAAGGNVRLLLPTSLAFLTASLVIVALQPRPVDVSRPIAAVSLPSSLAGLPAQPLPLTETERAYFVRYGGGAARAFYGTHGLLVVRTSAPLRHLHSPEECLGGSGHRVRYLGQTHDRLPTAVYRSTDPSGSTWRVEVTFVSDRGETATSVGQAVWSWLRRRDTTWTMVQRISPWDTAHGLRAGFDDAVARAFDIPVDAPIEPPATPAALRVASGPNEPAMNHRAFNVTRGNHHA